MVFHSRSSGATHTLYFFLTLSVLLPLPSLTNALTPTQRCTQVFTNHLHQICWSLCTQIKLMASRVRSQWTEWSSYRRSSLQYPAPKPDERSMIYQSVSVVLAWGWFTNTKHAARRREPPLSVVWWCSMELIMQSQLNKFSTPPPSYILCLMQQKGACLCSISGNGITAIEHNMRPKVCGLWWCFMAWLIAIGFS